MNRNQESDMTISLIIPVYNVEKYVERCLESVFAQTIPFDEVIVINDGSTDQSDKICKRILNNRANVVFLSQKNEGLGYTRNRGIQCAKGNYIMFLDADDELLAQTVEKLKEQLCVNSYDVIFFAGTVRVEDNSNKQNYFYSKKGMDCSNINSGKDYFERMYPLFFNVSACMALYKNSFLKGERILFQEKIFYEDNAFSIKAMLLASAVLCMDDEFYIRWVRQGSITQEQYTDKKMWDLFGVANKIYEVVTQNIKKKQIINSKYEDLIWKYYLIFMNVHEENFVHINIAKACQNIIEKMYEIDCSLEISEVSGIAASCIKKKIFLLEMIKKNNIVSEKTYVLMDRLSRKNEKIIEDRLNQIGLNDSQRVVGIYGVGLHTDHMLSAYEKRYGHIKAKLIFCTTDGLENTYRDSPVYPINKLNDNLDVLVISSFRHMKSMIKNIESMRLNVPVLRLYSEEETESIMWI